MSTLQTLMRMIEDDLRVLAREQATFERLKRSLVSDPVVGCVTEIAKTSVASVSFNDFLNDSTALAGLNDLARESVALSSMNDLLEDSFFLPNMNDLLKDPFVLPNMNDLLKDSFVLPNMNDLLKDSFVLPNMNDLLKDQFVLPNMNDLLKDSFVVPNMNDLFKDPFVLPNMNDLLKDSFVVPNMNDLFKDPFILPNMNDLLKDSFVLPNMNDLLKDSFVLPNMSDMLKDSFVLSSVIAASGIPDIESLRAKLSTTGLSVALAAVLRVSEPVEVDEATELDLDAITIAGRLSANDRFDGIARFFTDAVEILQAQDDEYYYPRAIHLAVCALEEVAKRLAGTRSKTLPKALAALVRIGYISSHQSRRMQQAYVLRSCTAGAAHGVGTCPKEVAATALFLVSRGLVEILNGVDRAQRS